MPKRLLKLPEVLQRTGLSRTQLYKCAKERTFPQPVSIGTHAVAWVEAEVTAWIDERIAARDAKGVRA